MPLLKGKSKKAFSHNVEAEMDAGKPQKQSLAIAYSMKRKAQHKSHGGYMAEGGTAQPSQPRPQLPGSPEDRKKIQDSFNHALGFAEGGMLTDSGYQSSCNEHCESPCMVHEQAEPVNAMLPEDPPHSEGRALSLNQHGASDEGAGDMDSIHPLIKKIMMSRAKGYSEGGKVANEDHGPMDSRLAGFKQNEFDDLALRDDLEESYTGKNSGDELGDAQEDSDRRDIVSRIMKSRAKKDRMPRPA